MIKTSLHLTNKFVLNNLLNHLTIVTKTSNSPAPHLPLGIMKMKKTQYMNEKCKFYLK